MSGPCNPLDKLNLGRSVAEALLVREVSSLANVADMAGAGVYAIYYVGEFSPYAPVAEKNRERKFEQPIYVGKGARKGGLAFDPAKGKALRECDSF